MLVTTPLVRPSDELRPIPRIFSFPGLFSSGEATMAQTLVVPMSRPTEISLLIGCSSFTGDRVLKFFQSSGVRCPFDNDLVFVPEVDIAKVSHALPADNVVPECLEP